MGRLGTKNLTYTQRLQIETLLNTKLSRQQMADVVGCSIRTLYYELKRGKCKLLNGSTWEEYYSYSSQIAQQRYDDLCTKKGRPLKLGNDYDFVNYINSRCKKEKISACAVLGQIKHLHLSFKTQISKPTLYRYITLGLFENIRLEKRKQKYKKQVMKRAPKGVSIEKRPSYIADRNVFGHWEMDCVCGSTKSTLLVLTERLTRKELIFKMDNQKSDSVIKCLNSLEHKFGKRFKSIFKSITVDNGSEFSNWKGMQKSIYGNSKRTEIYYCHPYCSSERGTNERMNREIRRLIPKGSNLAKYSFKQIQFVEDWLNNYPKVCLGYATANELFCKELSLIA